MKKILTCVSLSFFLFSKLFAQDIANDKFSLYLNIKDRSGTAVADQQLWLTDKESGIDFFGKTNSKGQSTFLVLKARTYSINFPDSSNYDEVKTPPVTSSTNFMAKSIVYTPSKNGLSAVADTVIQSYTSAPAYTKTECSVVIKVVDADEKELKNFEVRLVCSVSKLVYIANTGESGSAYFLIPVNRKYEVGFESYDKYSEFTLPANPVKMVKGIRYQPTIITENAKNDTVTQVLSADQKATSARVHITAMVKNFEGIALPDEEIFIDVEDDSLVYKAVTDNSGVAQFLIPKGKKYVLNFKYERSVDRLDYMDIDPLSMHEVEIGYDYIGSKKVQEFYATALRDESGFQVDFMKMGLAKITAEEAKEKMKMTKTSLGYNLSFEDYDYYIPSAYVEDDKMYIGGGDGEDLFCLDGETGNFNWGVELKEGGQSSIACDSDVVMLSTESCTLYAIDRNDGKLLWSKWLGPYLYSSPTVYNGNVYVTYPKDIDALKGAEYVLMCIRLKTGDIVWQKAIDRDVLGAPVAYDHRIYMTTYTGRLYSFDAADGSRELSNVAEAVSPPTISEGLMFVNIRTKDVMTRAELAIFDASTLKIIKRVPGIASEVAVSISSYNYPVLMNYSGGRVLNYNGMNYNIADQKLVCSKPSDGSVLWTADIDETSDTDLKSFAVNAPVAAGNKIIITSSTGKIKAFDPETGKMLKEFITGVALTGTPVVSNGWIFARSSDGKLVTINTQDKTYDGWNMWNLNGSHNTVVK